MAEPVPPPSPRQAMLAQLSGALAAPGREDADAAAGRDRCLRHGHAGRGDRPQHPHPGLRPPPAQPEARGSRLRALSGELDEFADEMLATAERVQQDSLLGRAVAEALGGHAADLAALAQQREGAEDPAAIRARLRPLVVTLDALPTRLKASRERTAEVGALAARAREAAARAGALAAGAIAVRSGTAGPDAGAVARARPAGSGCGRGLGAILRRCRHGGPRRGGHGRPGGRTCPAGGPPRGRRRRCRGCSAPAMRWRRRRGQARVQAIGERAGPSHSWTGAMNWNLGRGRR